MKKTLLILTALLALTGCGTVVKLIDPSEKYTPYAGAAYDLEMAKKWGLRYETQSSTTTGCRICQWTLLGAGWCWLWQNSRDHQ